MSRHFRLRNIKECLAATAGSLRLDARKLDPLSPLPGCVCDALAEGGGRARKYFTPEFGHPSVHRRLGERRVDFIVELVNDLGRGAFGNAEAEPAGYRVARDNIAAAALRISSCREPRASRSSPCSRSNAIRSPDARCSTAETPVRRIRCCPAAAPSPSSAP